MKRFLALDQGLCFVLEDLALVFLEKKSSLISLSSLMNRRQPLSHMSNSLSLPSPHYMSELYRPIFSINTVPSVGIFSWGPIPWPVPVTSPEKQEGYKGEKFQSQTISDPPEPQSMLGFVSEQFYIGEDCEGLPVLWQHVRCSSDIILFFLLTKAVQGPWVGLGWTSGTGSQSVLGLHLHIRRDSSSHGHFWNLPLQL